MPALTPAAMPRSLFVSSRARASVLFAGLLLSGCGGAAAADREAEPPHGGTGSSAAASASPTMPDAGFMRVGDVARETLAAPAATVQPEKAPPKLPATTDKNTKATTSGTSTSTPARAGNPPPPPRGTGGEGGSKPDSDDDASLATPTDGPKGVHAAVVDSASNLSEAEVRTTIVQRQASFRECYDLGASSAAGAFSGTINLRVSIGPTGTVASVDVLTSTTKVAVVDSCVAQAVRRIVFPAKGNGAVVAFPIEFGR